MPFCKELCLVMFNYFPYVYESEAVSLTMFIDINEAQHGNVQPFISK